MNIGNKGRENCCGCTACANICPHDAITMEADKLGFIYPQIDYEKCVDCGLCAKYVQSDIRGIFQQIKNDLKSGRLVLFSGTPCQVSGLQSYVGKKWQTNLYTIDIVCHGVPAPKVWSDYVQYMEKKIGDVCVKANFRDKCFGWATHFETFLFKNNVVKSGCTFRILFYKHYMLRDSCYQCPFTNLKRCSDITVGDFWGWDKISTELNDNRGVSLVLVNSDKGRDLLDEVASKFYLVRSNTTDCLQPQLQYPCTVHPKRNAFISDYKGFFVRC